MINKELKEKIDKMSQYEMARIWRFAKVGNELLQGEVGSGKTAVAVSAEELQFTNSDAANQLLNPPYREGWTL